LRGLQYENEKARSGHQENRGNRYTKKSLEGDQLGHPLDSKKAEAKLAKEHGVGTSTIKRDATFAKGVDTVPVQEKDKILQGTSELTKKDVSDFAKIEKEKAAKQAKIDQEKAKAEQNRIAKEQAAKQAEQQRLQSEKVEQLKREAEEARYEAEQAKMQAEKAKLEIEKVAQERAKQLLKQKEDEKKAKKQEKELKRKQEIERIAKEIEMSELDAPSGLYDVLVVDPPWSYGTQYSANGRRVANPYPEMSQAELLKISLPAKKDSTLYLWTTHKFIQDAFELMDKWGFVYRQILTWDKEKIGMGDHLRMQCEFCLIGFKGKPIFNNTHTDRDIIRESRREHSRKPEAFYDFIDRFCIGSKLDYFSRQHREGWETYGAEEGKF